MIDIQTYMNAMMSVHALERSKTMMTLGELIAALDKVDGGINIAIELPTGEVVIPTDLISYRGYYSDLAIDYGIPNEDSVRPVEVDEFRGWLREAIGKTYTGYKGGDFTMSKITPMWVDNYGRCQNFAVSEVVYDDYNCIIKTNEQSE